MGDRYLILDLSNKEFSGDILDVSYEGNTVISELINNEYEKDFYSLKKPDATIGKFDNIIFFLSINKQYRNNARWLIRNVKKNLKSRGKIIIWDLDYKKIKLNESIHIKIINKENKIKTLKDKFKFDMFALNCNRLVKIIEEEGFKVEKKYDENIIYYIEAKLMEDLNENTTCGT